MLRPSMIREHQYDKASISSSRVKWGRRLDFHGGEIPRAVSNAAKAFDQSRHFLIAGPRREMEGHYGARLRTDTKGRNGTVWTRKKHAEGDQAKGPDQHP